MRVRRSSNSRTSVHYFGISPCASQPARRRQSAKSDALAAERDFHRMIVNRTPPKRADPDELKVLPLASSASSFATFLVMTVLVMTVGGGIAAGLF
jgi:hypothetical protein